MRVFSTPAYYYYYYYYYFFFLYREFYVGPDDIGHSSAATHLKLVRLSGLVKGALYTFSSRDEL